METKRVLNWVIKHVLPESGIEAWTGYGCPYPEITGYTIPTLLKLGQDKLARSLGEWLSYTQNADGSWSGLDGWHCTFDTAACVEGLTEVGDYMAVAKGLDFIEARVRVDKTLERWPGDNGRGHIYLARAAWILDDPMVTAQYIPSSPWPASWGNVQRPHYVAYLLEGLYNTGYRTSIRPVLEAAVGVIRTDGLMPMWVGAGWKDGMGTDLCATAQFALLYLRTGRLSEANRLIEAVEREITPTGGIPQSLDDRREISWAAKYYLDICAHVEAA